MEEDLSKIDFPRIPVELEIKGLDHFLMRDASVHREKAKSAYQPTMKKAQPIKQLPDYEASEE